MSRPNSISVLLCAIALLSPAAHGRADAQCDTPVLSIHVDSIFAGEAGSEIDQRLKSETGRLQALFDYSSYRLLRTDEADTACGQEVAFILPVERILHVRPLATHRNAVVLDLALFAGARALMRTQLKVSRGGLLLLVGEHSPQEAYITTLTIGTPGSLPASGPLGAATAIATPLPSAKTSISGR